VPLRTSVQYSRFEESIQNDTLVIPQDGWRQKIPPVTGILDRTSIDRFQMLPVLGLESTSFPVNDAGKFYVISLALDDHDVPRMKVSVSEYDAMVHAQHRV